MTVKSEEEIRRQLKNEQKTLKGIKLDAKQGLGFWGKTTGYIDALKWVLGEEL